MKRISAALTIVLLVIAIVAPVQAGQGFRIVIFNKTKLDLTVRMVEDSCWYENDLGSPIKVDPGKARVIYTEAKNSGICLLQPSEMTFEVKSSTSIHGDYGTYYLRKVGNKWKIRSNKTGEEIVENEETGCFYLCY